MYIPKLLTDTFEVKDMTQKEKKNAKSVIKTIAGQLELDAKAHFDKDPTKKKELDDLAKVARTALAQIDHAYSSTETAEELIQNLKGPYQVLKPLHLKFIAFLLENNFLAVSYIFNYCFVDKTTRALFGNMPNTDDKNNTALHYAARAGFNETICILLDKRPTFASDAKTSDKNPRIRFVLENSVGETPFMLACKGANLTTFNLFWYGRDVGKSNHNPKLKSLEYAHTGKNDIIIKTIADHPKLEASQAGMFKDKPLKRKDNPVEESDGTIKKEKTAK